MTTETALLGKLGLLDRVADLTDNDLPPTEPDPLDYGDPMDLFDEPEWPYQGMINCGTCHPELLRGETSDA